MFGLFSRQKNQENTQEAKTTVTTLGQVQEPEDTTMNTPQETHVVSESPVTVEEDRPETPGLFDTLDTSDTPNVPEEDVTAAPVSVTPTETKTETETETETDNDTNTTTSNVGVSVSVGGDGGVTVDDITSEEASATATATTETETTAKAETETSVPVTDNGNETPVPDVTGTNPFSSIMNKLTMRLSVSGTCSKDFSSSWPTNLGLKLTDKVANGDKLTEEELATCNLPENLAVYTFYQGRRQIYLKKYTRGIELLNESAEMGFAGAYYSLWDYFTHTEKDPEYAQKYYDLGLAAGNETIRLIEGNRVGYVAFLKRTKDLLDGPNTDPCQAFAIDALREDFSEAFALSDAGNAEASLFLAGVLEGWMFTNKGYIDLYPDFVNVLSDHVALVAKLYHEAFLAGHPNANKLYSGFVNSFMSERTFDGKVLFMPKPKPKPKPYQSPFSNLFGSLGSTVYSTPTQVGGTFPVASTSDVKKVSHSLTSLLDMLFPKTTETNTNAETETVPEPESERAEVLVEPTPAAENFTDTDVPLSQLEEKLEAGNPTFETMASFTNGIVDGTEVLQKENAALKRQVAELKQQVASNSYHSHEGGVSKIL